MEDIRDFDLQEFIRINHPKDVYENQVVVMEIDGINMGINKTRLPIRLNARSTILVCKGEMNITIDYLPYILQQNMVLEQTNNLINDIRISYDFKGYHVILGDKIPDFFFREIIHIPKEYPTNKRLNPVLKLDANIFKTLIDITERLRYNIHRADHVFQKGLIVNEILNFIMEIINFRIQNTDIKNNTTEKGYYEELIMNFVQLLVEKGRQWHEVADYSTELCVTPVYLSRILKNLSGKSAIDWIHEARIAEAKILLRKTDRTIQDVADILYFSDQSAFGKFFKKRTGISPLEYKKSL